MAKQTIALVTGAASGLGAAVACRLLGANYSVIGVDREAQAIRRAIDHPNLAALSADLADTARIATLAAAVRESVGLLVHCAGTSAVGPFVAAAPSALAAVYRVNLLAPILLTQALLAADRFAPGATIVFVASLSHYVGYPGAAMYAASKDGLAAYGRALDVALAGRDVRTLTVFPGPIDTRHAQAFAPPGSSRGKRLPPDRIARSILAAVATRKTRLIVGPAAHAARFLGVVWPSGMTRFMGRTLWPKLSRLGTH